MTDTLQDTFDKYFNVNEDTAGTGTVIRDIRGTLQTIVVDQAEYDAFRAEIRAEADVRNAVQTARNRVETEYYAEEPVR